MGRRSATSPAASASTQKVRSERCQRAQLQSTVHIAEELIRGAGLPNVVTDSSCNLESEMSRYCSGDSDATVILKPAPGSRRWQHISTQMGAHAAPVDRQTERNYTVILGSHRNTRLKVEKDGQLCESVRSGPSGILGPTTVSQLGSTSSYVLPCFARCCTHVHKPSRSSNPDTEWHFLSHQ